jgi:NAD(P)-dependent dehydrogenase (short-subunit alcohol dehydrogenase family)
VPGDDGTLRFDGRVAIVTGAGGGLGREYALLLAERGAKVVVNDIGTDAEGSGSASSAHAVALEITKDGGVAVADAHSIADPEGGAAIVQTALDRFGRVDILINNAGTNYQAPFADLPFAALDEILAVNLRGVFCVTQPAWRAMAAQRYGRILNIISGTVFGFPQSAATAAAKAGLIGLTRALAYEGVDEGIGVNALAPVAYTRTMASIPDEAFREWMSANCPPCLVAPVAAWLVHQDNPVSGELFTAGGGRAARVFLGVTPGHRSEDLTLEEVRDHFDSLQQESGYFVPATALEELAHFRLPR